MNEFEYNIPQSFVSGVSYRELQLVSEECYSNSIDVLYDILPKGSEITVYPTAKMEVDISDTAFEKIKSRMNIDIENPRIGEITCTKVKGKIEVSFTIGKEQLEVPLQKIDSDLLKMKVETPLMIEKGLSFNDMPYRTIKITPERIREKPKHIVER